MQARRSGKQLECRNMGRTNNREVATIESGKLCDPEPYGSHHDGRVDDLGNHQMSDDQWARMRFQCFG